MWTAQPKSKISLVARNQIIAYCCVRIKVKKIEKIFPLKTIIGRHCSRKVRKTMAFPTSWRNRQFSGKCEKRWRFQQIFVAISWRNRQCLGICHRCLSQLSHTTLDLPIIILLFPLDSTLHLQDDLSSRRSKTWDVC